VRQREAGGRAHVVAGDGGAPVPGRVGGSGAGGHDVGTQAVDPEGRAQLRDGDQGRVVERHLGDEVLRGTDPSGERGLGVGEARREAGRVGVEGQPATHDLGAGGRVARRGHLHGEAEAVQQLGPQLALLGVHRADEDEPGGVLHGHAVALHRGAAHRGRVEQEVDQVVVQQVDLVDVEHAAVRASQQAGLVAGDAASEGLLEVEGAEHAVLGGTHGQLDEPHRAGLDRCVRPERTVRRQGGVGRIAGEPVARDHLDRRQHGREGTHERRLGRALLPSYEHAADGGRDRREDEGEGHVVELVGLGSDDGREGVVLWHEGSRSIAMAG
jgi:hypothetical protein